MAALAPLLRSLRERAGLTQEELASRAGLSTRTVSDIERGLRLRLYADTTDRLSDALALDADVREQFRDAARGREADPRHQAALPRPLTALVGRGAEVAELSRLLLPGGRRLVTVTGLGGVGKTRVALAACDHLEAAYDGMVRFAAVAPNQDPARVPGLVAASLDAASDLTPDQLRSHLAGRPALVLLDAFEHALDAAPAIESLLVAVPTLHLLVTSRVRVPVTGAHEVALEPLAIPDPSSEAWSTTGAVALFLARAADVRADVTDHPDLVVEVCRRVSGLPLALELAAARLRHLPLAALAVRLRDDLDELVEAQDVQRSLAGTVTSAVDVLSPAHRSVLRACSLFAAGWRQDVLQEMCGDEVDVMGAMGELVDRGLVVLDGAVPGEGVPRWRMLDVVREIVSRASDLGPELRASYQRAVLALVTRTLQDIGREARWFRVLASEEPNVRTALRWAQQQADAEGVLRLGCGMWQYWQAAGALTEGRQWLSIGLAMEPAASDEARMTALWASGWLAYQQGDYAAAAAAGAELDALAADAGGPAERRNALTIRGIAAIAEERAADAIALLTDALALARGLDQPWILATSLLNLGLAQMAAADPAGARVSVGEALGRYAEIGDERFHARSLGYLGLISLMEEDLPRAHTLLTKSLAAFHEVGEPSGMAEGLVGLAAVHAASGGMSRAAMLAGAAERIRQGIAGRGFPPDRRTTERHLAAARAALGPDGWDDDFARGRGLSLDEAVALGVEAV
jgi:predicted ATPase/DNA-binding XRE family transcriptional regulator